VQIYTSETRNRTLISILKEMWRSVFSGFYAGYSLCTKQLVVEQSKSKLGILWDAGEPLALGLVFVLLYQYRAIGTLDSGLPYALFVISGIMMWQSLTDAITNPLTSIIKAKELLLNTHIAPESLMWASIIRVFYNTLFRFLVVVVFALFFQQCSILSALLAFVFIVVCVTLFSAVGFLLAPFNTISEDVSRFINLVLRPLMFISGVLFPVSGIQELEVFNSYNVFLILIDSFRDVFFNLDLSNSTQIMMVATFFIPFYLLAWYIYHASIVIVAEKG
jgi:lipopolysaccharide transport system permease protein